MGGAPTARTSFRLLQERPEVQQGLRRQSPRCARFATVIGHYLQRTRALPLPPIRLPALASNLDGFEHHFARTRWRRVEPIRSHRSYRLIFA
jgi:hypothetical protein